jgi:hypothetical protein
MNIIYSPSSRLWIRVMDSLIPNFNASLFLTTNIHLAKVHNNSCNNQRPMKDVLDE